MKRATFSRYKLRTTLIMAILLMIIPAVLVTGIFHVVQLYNLAQTSIEQEIGQSVAAYSNLIGRQIDSYISQLSVAARDPRLQDVRSDDPEVAAALEDYANHIGFLTILYTDLDGNTSAGSQVGDRAYFQHILRTGDSWVTSPLSSRAFNRTVLMVSTPILNAHNEITGVLIAHLAIDDFSDILNELHIGEHGYGFVVDSTGQLVAHPDTARVAEMQTIPHNSQGLSPEEEAAVLQMLSSSGPSIERTGAFRRDGNRYFIAHTQIPKASEEWILGIVVSPSDFMAGTLTTLLFTVLFTACILVAGIIVAIGVSRHIAGGITEIAYAAEQLAEGDISVEISQDYHNELGVLSRSFHKMAAAIREQSEILNEIAEGDYTADISPRSPHDVMSHSFAHLIEDGNKMMLEIRQTEEQVAAAAKELAKAAQILSSGAHQQAAFVEEFSTSLTQAAQHAQHNQEHAKNVLDVMLETSSQFSQGARAMEQVLQYMSSIRSNAHDTAGIINLIEDIAFQTNILALNAAVEAAHAGPHGRGFAVVADEVRRLSGKSAEAAKETADLISRSLELVERGSDYVNQTSTFIDKTMQTAGHCVQLTQNIAEESEVQKNAFAEITQSVSHITQITQSNSATAVETASAAEEMEAQSEDLSKIVRRFRLKEYSSNGSPTFQEPPFPPLVAQEQEHMAIYSVNQPQ